MCGGPITGARCQLENLIDAIVAIRVGGAEPCPCPPADDSGSLLCTAKRLGMAWTAVLGLGPRVVGSAATTRT